MHLNMRCQTGLLFTAMIVIMVAHAAAQWVKVPPPSIPRGPDGKPNLTAPAPRAADGRPDLSGIWEAISTKYLDNIAADMKPEDIPYQPWAKALVESRAGGAHAREESNANCLPPGVPKTAAAPPPWKIIQTPNQITILHEALTLWRQIFIDGREFAADLRSLLAGLFRWQVGWRQIGRREQGLQRKDVAGPGGQPDDRGAARHRAFPPKEYRHA